MSLPSICEGCLPPVEEEDRWCCEYGRMLETVKDLFQKMQYKIDELQFESTRLESKIEYLEHENKMVAGEITALRWKI